MAIVKRILNTSEGVPLVIVRQDELLIVENDVRKMVALYSHAKKRLSDEFGIDLDNEWEARVVGGEHDVPFPDAYETQYLKMEKALRNVSMTARRLIHKTQNLATPFVADVQHIIRFCEEAGVTSNVLRSGPLTDEDKEVLFDPAQHMYRTTADIMSNGCAVCGRPEEEHQTI